MSNAYAPSKTSTENSIGGAVDMKLEVVVLPVADVERSLQFYKSLGWRLDVDRVSGERRVVHFTPPGSSCSILFGTDVTPSAPGSAQLLHLVVTDIEAAQAELVANGVEVSGIFHDVGGGYNRFDLDQRASGLDPERRTYASFLTFNDPDGNNWLLQEVTARLPGRIDSHETSFASVADLAGAMRRAAAAHGEHERRIGRPDPNWPDGYAAYMVAEQAGKQPPS